MLRIWANLVLWENYLTCVGKNVPKESRNRCCVISVWEWALRHWRDMPVCRWLLSPKYQDTHPCELTLSSADLLLGLLSFCQAVCTELWLDCL